MRYRIEEIGVDGDVLHPEDVRQKFIKQLGVLVRDMIPITVQEWNQPKSGGVPYVGDVLKDHIYRKLMHNFNLPLPDVEPDEMDQACTELEKKKSRSMLSRRWPRHSRTGRRN